MRSISLCIKRAGKAVTPKMADELIDRVKTFKGDQELAVQDYLTELNDQIADLENQLLEQANPGLTPPSQVEEVQQEPETSQEFDIQSQLEEIKSAISELGGSQDAALGTADTGTLEGVSTEQGQATGNVRDVDAGNQQSGPGDNQGNGQPDRSGTDGTGGLGANAGETTVSEPGARSGGKRGNIETTDYTIQDSDNLGSGGAKTKFKQNIAAVRLVREFIEDPSRRATKEEQAVLVKYVGWGGMPQAFVKPNGSVTKGWETQAAELQEILTPEEYSDARRSTQDAHYTSQEVIGGIYAGLERLGFKGGSILEPSLGSGNFFGLMPQLVRQASKLTGVELDTITGEIAKQLYQSAKVSAPTGFQDFPMTDGTFDLAIGNPPFGSQKIYDGKRKDISKFSIHNYFFAKSLNGLRQNGILAMVVSKGLLDKASSKEREYLANRAELLGAIRLPNNAFLKNAGTEVTTDIIFLRKLGSQETPDYSWTETVDITGADGTTIKVNKYFAENPNMMLGEMRSEGSMYRANEPALVARKGDDISELLAEAIQNLPENVYSTISEPVSAAFEPDVQLSSDIRDVLHNGFFFQDGELRRRGADINGEPSFEVVKTRLDSSGKEVPFKERQLERIRGMAEVGQTVSQILKLQLGNYTDEDIAPVREELNKQYDTFVKKNGFINSTTNKSLMRQDPLWPRLAALEPDYDRGVSAAVAKSTGQEKRAASAKKADIFSTRTQFPYQPVSQVTTPADGLTASLSERGKLDLPYIEQLYGKPEAQIIEELGNTIYQDPMEGWQTAEEYLSGNVKKKLQIAKENAALDPVYSRNIEALTEVLPEDIAPIDIIVKIGAPWLPNDVMNDFTNYLAGEDIGVNWTYVAPLAKWNFGGRISSTAKLKDWGTPDRTSYELIQAASGNKPVKITRRDSDGNAYVDAEATAAANQKVNDLKQEFEDWIWEAAERRERLGKIYNDTINTSIGRSYNGKHLVLPGKVPEELISLRPHQKNFIWRSMQSKSVLADHVVGAGKTFAIIGAVMEAKRTGFAKKPALVVPNHLVKQWSDDYLKLYPNANLLVPDKKDFAGPRRRELFARIATGQYDAIIIPISSFKKLPTDPDETKRFIDQQLEDLTESLKAVKESGDRTSVKELEKQKERLENKLKEMADIAHQDDGLTFQDLGIDMIASDESHEFKNLEYTTGMGSISGLGNPTGSAKAADMFIKTQSIINRGGRVIFATGTPISNSISEMYTMQRYLDYAGLREQGLAHFDAWANVFGEVVSDFELDATGVNYKMNSRFNKFVNMPELMTQYSKFADVITRDDINALLAEQGKTLPIPKIKGGKPQNIVIPRTDAQSTYMEDIVKRATNIPTDKKIDNMLKITSDARKAALDMRLIDPDYGEAGGKTNEAVAKIKEIADKWADQKGTQLVFLDLSTPKGAASAEKARIRTLIEKADQGDEKASEELAKVSPDEILSLDSDFSVYDDMRAKLIASGFAEDEVAFIHSANTDEKKAALFEKVRRGDVRVLMGSTGKMGAGMNVQDRLVALHHLDAPWKPSDLEQREGRIIRQGNSLYDADPEGFEIEIYRYATEQTYDSRMWQTIEGKARFIEQLRSGQLDAREVEDVAAESASAAEMKAAASGNPLILEEFKLRDQVKKLEQKERQFKRAKYQAVSDADFMQTRLDALPEEQAIIARDVETLQANPLPVAKKKDDPSFAGKIGNKNYSKRKDFGQAIISEAKSIIANREKDRVIGSLRGFDVSVGRDYSDDTFKIGLSGEWNYGNERYYLNNDPGGLATQLNNRLESIANLLENKQIEQSNAERDIPVLLEKGQQEFKEAAELSELRDQHNEILAELSAKGEDDTPDGPEDLPDDAMSFNPSRDLMIRDDNIVLEFGRDSIYPSRPGRLELNPQVVSSEKPDSEVKGSFEMIQAMRNHFNVPVRSGRIRGKAQGTHDPRDGVIRLRRMAEIEVFTHELGHALESRYGSELTRIIKAYKDEMAPLSYDPDLKETQLLREGFAEFFSIYVLNPANAEYRAPKFAAAFENYMTKNHAEDLAMIDGVQKDYQSYLFAPSGAAIKANMATSDKGPVIKRALSALGPENIKETVGINAMKFYASFFDRLHPIYVAVEKLSKIREKNKGSRLDLKRSEDSYALARLAVDAYSGAHVQIQKGVIPYNGAFPEGPSFTDAVQKAMPEGKYSDETVEDFGSYLISRRAIHEWDRFMIGELQNKPTKETKADHKANIELLERENPQFSEAAGILYEFLENQWGRKYEAGLLTNEQYLKGIEQHTDYVPFMRDRSDLGDKSTASGLGDTGSNGVLKRFKGSDRPIINPLESIMADVYETEVSIKGNDSRRALVDIAKDAGYGSGAVVEKIPDNEIRRMFIGMEEIKQALVTQMDWSALTERDSASLEMVLGGMDDIDAPGLSFFRAGDINERGEPIIFVWEGGKREAYRLADGEFGMELYNAFTTLNREEVPLLVDLLSLPAQTMRLGITVEPTFQVTNTIRGELTTWMLDPNYTPGVDFGKGLKSSVAFDEMKQAYVGAGGIMGGVNANSMAAKRAKQDIETVSRTGADIRRVSWRGFLAATEISESAMRIGLFRKTFEKAKKEGYTDKEAVIEGAFTARDITDYGRHGSKMLSAQRIITFMNAHFQGMDKFSRTLGGSGSYQQALRYVFGQTESLTAREQKNLSTGRKLVTKMVLVGMAGAALTMLYSDDEEYQEFSEYLRTMHWMVKAPMLVDGEWKLGWYAIPKPFQEAMLGNIMERAYGAYYYDDPEEMEKMKRGIMMMLGPPMIPVAIRPTIEHFANKSLYNDMPLISDRLKGLDPEKQYYAWTSSLAKKIGKANGIPPVLIDHYIVSYTGSMGRTALGLTTAVDENAPTLGGDDMFFLRRFIRDWTRSSSSKTDFYRMMSRDGGSMTAKYSTFKMLVSDDSNDEARAYLGKLKDHEAAYVMARYTGAIAPGKSQAKFHPLHRAQLISRYYNQARNNVRDSETIKPDKKRRLDDLISQRVVMEMRNAMIASGLPGYQKREMFDLSKNAKSIEKLSPKTWQLMEDLSGNLHTAQDTYNAYPSFQADMLKMRAEIIESTGDIDPLNNPLDGVR